MKKHGEIVTEEGFVLKFYDRPSSDITINLPDDVIETLEKVAAERNLPIPAILKLYVGQSMRVDLAENFPELARELFERRFRNRKNGTAKKEKAEVHLAA